ncbi:MAK10-like protein [Tanacetum coccineum]
MGSILGNNTGVLADQPPGCKPLGCKWIFKTKQKVDGTSEKFKARLVIQGFRQKSRIDYFDTYALVARISTIRLLIAMASIHNMIIHQIDVKTAFLNGCISTWEDLTTRFLAQFFLPRRTVKLCNDILMFPQHQGEYLSEAWTQDLTLYANESWNDPRDLVKPVKAISLPQDVPSTSDRRLIELENQVQRLMKAHLAHKQPTQVNKITSSCEICSGPHDTQYCMENPEQAFVDYASSCTDEAGGGDNPKILKIFLPNGSFPNRSFNNHPQSFNNQSNLEGLVSNFMASQNARLSKFKADFKQQQSEMTNKVDSVLKAITNRITVAHPSYTVKNPKLNVNSTSPVSSSRSYLIEDPQCSTRIHSSINAITICPKWPSKLQNGQPEEEEQEENDNPENINSNPSSPPDPSVSFITEKVLKLNSFFESLDLISQSSNTEFVCTKGDDDGVMFIEIIKKNDDSHKEEPEVGENARVGELEVEYFDIFLTRSELAY